MIEDSLPDYRIPSKFFVEDMTPAQVEEATHLATDYADAETFLTGALGALDMAVAGGNDEAIEATRAVTIHAFVEYLDGREELVEFAEGLALDQRNRGLL